MLIGTRHAHPFRHRFQHGQAILLVVMLVGMATALFVYGMVDTTSAALRRDKDVAAVLAQAKQALIGYAASDPNRPGSLPCPDTDNSGTAQAFSGSECPGYIPASNVYVGRLPWRTLGLPDLRDGSGERLWYAVSRTFAMNPSCIPSCPPALNSDTLGQLTVTGPVAASNVIAIIFAPGGAISPQTRDAANENSLTNYLENENATNGNSTFSTGPDSTTFNDRLLFITTAELMPPVELRVARELRSALQAYKANSACACYPWTDISDGTSQTDLNRGRVPTNALPENWGTGTIPALPTWFVNNNWRLVIYYAVGRNYLQSGGGACTSCVDPTLTFDGASPKEIVIIMPGPKGVSGAHTNWPNDYFEDAQNAGSTADHSGNGYTGNDLYVTPSSTAYARDRVYTIP